MEKSKQTSVSFFSLSIFLLLLIVTSATPAEDISYRALRRGDQTPCSRRSTSYFNCHESRPANPYKRACSQIQDLIEQKDLEREHATISWHVVNSLQMPTNMPFCYKLIRIDSCDSRNVKNAIELQLLLDFANDHFEQYNSVKQISDLITLSPSSPLRATQRRRASRCPQRHLLRHWPAVALSFSPEGTLLLSRVVIFSPATDATSLVVGCFLTLSDGLSAYLIHADDLTPPPCHQTPWATALLVQRPTPATPSTGSTPRRPSSLSVGHASTTSARCRPVLLSSVRMWRSLPPLAATGPPPLSFSTKYGRRHLFQREYGCRHVPEAVNRNQKEETSFFSLSSFSSTADLSIFSSPSGHHNPLFSCMLPLPQSLAFVATAGHPAPTGLALPPASPPSSLASRCPLFLARRHAAALKRRHLLPCDGRHQPHRRLLPHSLRRPERLSHTRRRPRATSLSSNIVDDRPLRPAPYTGGTLHRQHPSTALLP
ncbi:hypothetical protein ZIOFF_075021 [Zingiber officinale]|uniref:Uncharacterized protein n=1 Tax=Zingiber officinale TaxID=94328 RepID=A0A8J5BVQ3_ZINOF|nr:hypothetical protein ZIOFF_075021 [Zingiber officinale]